MNLLGGEIRKSFKGGKSEKKEGTYTGRGSGFLRGCGHGSDQSPIPYASLGSSRRRIITHTTEKYLGTRQIAL